MEERKDFSVGGAKVSMLKEAEVCNFYFLKNNYILNACEQLTGTFKTYFIGKVFPIAEKANKLFQNLITRVKKRLSQKTKIDLC